MCVVDESGWAWFIPLHDGVVSKDRALPDMIDANVVYLRFPLVLL